jgi:hypothetical protein
MALTPAGLLAKPLDLVLDLFANLSAFQTWVGHAGNAAAAKSGHCHLDAAEPDPVTGVVARPYIIAMLGPRTAGDSRRGGAGACNHFVHDWEIVVQATAAVTAIYRDTPADAYLEFANAWGGVLAAMEGDAAKGGKANVVGWRALQAPFRADAEGVGSPEGDFWFQEVMLSLAEGL